MPPIRHVLLLALAFGMAAPGWAACTQIDGMPATENVETLASADVVLGKETALHVQVLRDVYRRIAAAAAIRPALLVCDDAIFNAHARGAAAQGSVTFFVPMLRFLNGNADEVAAVMAHEFAHLMLNHTQYRQSAAANINGWARRVAVEQYRKSGSTGQAIDHALKMQAVELASFSRRQEREADEKGFSLAVTLAKFSGTGGKELVRKLGRLPQGERPPYLDSHPGWLERLEKADVLTLNQDYIDQAAPLLAARAWQPLNVLVERWLREVPTSGGAWYYKARLLTRNSPSATRVTQAYENAVTRYVDNTALGTTSQEDQSELDDAWFQLCRALHAEGYQYESIHCAARMANARKREQLLAATSESRLLIVADNAPQASGLMLGRDGNGDKLITNDAAVAASGGAYLPAAPQWRANRFPEPPRR